MRRSVVIGVNQYEFADRLSGCVRDATDIATVLAEQEYGFESSVLLDGDATRRNCLDALWTAAEDHGDFLVLYFAGHGGIHGGAGYLVTTDGVARDPGIGLPELAHIIAAASQNYSHVITILDACHSGAGSLWNDHRPLTAASVSDAIEVVNSSRILMAACRPEQFAYEVDEPEAHGAFTKVLLEALTGDAVDFGGNVTVHGLFEAVASRMDDERQTPVFKGDSAGSVVIGSGFQPREGAPLPPTEKAALLAKAERFLDEYQILQTRELSRSEHRRTIGLSNCARSLTEIIRWFDDAELEDRDIVRDPTWKRFRHSLLNYQGSLASVGEGDVLPIGRIERLVGAGGFGNVWAVQGERRLAYKVFHGSELGESVKARRFRNGFHSMASLTHPRIVSVRELTEAPLAFSMELIEGADLRDSHFDRSDPTIVLGLALDIADTIRYAHGAGVIHRDIKPENVILEWDPESETQIPQLTDFDLAYIETNRTVTVNMVGGVVNYAAPEQFYASNSATARALTVDVYAFAQLLFFIFLKADPSPDRRDTNLGRFSDAVGALFSYEPAEMLIALYEQSTAVDPESRPQSMEEVCATLTRIRIAHETVSTQVGFTAEQICQQVAYGYVGPGRYSTTADGVDLQSRAETLSVGLRPRGVPHDGRSDFVYTISASQSFGVPGAGSGTQARAILNQRLDRRLQRFPEVHRSPGNQGYFQTHLLVEGILLTVEGAARLTDVLSTAIGAIERLD